MTARTTLFCLALLAACASTKPAQAPPAEVAIPAPEESPPKRQADGRYRVIINGSPIGSGWVGHTESIPTESPRLADVVFEHSEIAAEISVAAYEMPLANLPNAANKLRNGFGNAGAVSRPITVSENGDRAWFTFEVEQRGRRISGKAIVFQVHQDPSIILVLIGQWAPEYHVQLAEEVDLMADGLTVTIY